MGRTCAVPVEGVGSRLRVRREAQKAVRRSIVPALALSGDGNTMALGGWVASKTYVYSRRGSTWSADGPALVTATLGARYFGQSVALSFDGNRLAVGDHGEKSNATGVNGDPNNQAMDASGAVYGFTRANGVWTKREYVKASNPYYGTQFGISVAVSHDARTLAAGSHWELSKSTGINGSQDNSASAYGAVHVFQ